MDCGTLRSCLAASRGLTMDYSNKQEIGKIRYFNDRFLVSQTQATRAHNAGTRRLLGCDTDIG